MQLFRPTFDLGAFKAAYAESKVEITGSAMRGAHVMGIDDTGMAEVVAKMERAHFYKSMTSYGDHRAWQDVYHVPHGPFVIYVKFTAGKLSAFKLLSFKEKEE